VYTSGALRPGPPQLLCGTDKVSFVAPSQVAVAESARACPARLRLTGQDGEQLAVPLTVPARSKARLPAVSVARLYCFARSAGRAIYITIDDGWTPSAEVLDLMHQTYLPITAFLIANAARQNLSYWKAFVAAGGMIGDHTVSHPYLTRLTLSQATAQWGQDRTLLGRWLGQTPAVGRPPYGAFDPAVEVAAARGGLTALAGWSATMSGDRIETWNGKPLSPGEIVILHWVPGLGHQLTALLAAIRARHLNPTPLTPASFAVLAVATLGLLLIEAATPLWLIAAILAGRSVAIGLVVAPLLQALVQPLRPDQLGDASTLFNTWQRIAGSFGIGLVAAQYATRARTLGPVAALHTAGLVLVAIAVAGALGALALPAGRDTAAAR
jgi:peptidoglycan/xylan/chitin deacetylase (PgdA/CDA1 family)